MTDFNKQYLTDVLTVLATETRGAIERGDARLKATSDANYADLNTKLASLLDLDLANQISVLKELIDNLDGDIVGNLLTLKGLAEQALAVAISADTKGTSALAEIEKLKALYNNYVGEQAASQQDVQAALTAGEQAIADLQACCKDTLKRAEVVSMIDTNNQQFYDACDGAVLRFTEIMRGYPASGDIV